MYLWQVFIDIARPLPAFPRPYVVAVERHDDPSYHCEGRFRQSEDHSVFVYTLEGSGIFRDALGEHPTPAGSAFLCRVADAETAYYYPEGETAPWSFLWLGFSGQAANALVDDLVGRYGYLYTLPRERSIVQRLLAFRHYAASNYDMLPVDGGQLVLDLLMALGQSAQRFAVVDTRHKLMQRAQQVIQEQLDGEISVSLVAQDLGISREHLARVFKEHTGLSPHEYITRKRMLVACHLLKDTTRSTGEIAAAVGFPQQTNFTRAFKHLLGMTPSQFRKYGTIPMM